MDRSSQLDFTNIFVSAAGFGWKFEFGFLFYRIATLKRVVRLHCAQCLEFD